MQSNIIIRKVLSAAMLIVFAFSVTPKILLHNLVADHRDTPRSHNNSKQDQLSKTGFNCNCENLVVESPFVNDYVAIDFSTPLQFFQKQVSYNEDFLSLNYFYFNLRGPPAFMLNNLS